MSDNKNSLSMKNIPLKQDVHEFGLKIDSLPLPKKIKLEMDEDIDIKEEDIDTKPNLNVNPSIKDADLTSEKMLADTLRHSQGVCKQEEPATDFPDNMNDIVYTSENDNKIDNCDNDGPPPKKSLKRLCKFCHEYFVRLSIHVTNAHGDIEEIHQIKSLNSKERNAALKRITNEGILLHNKKTLEAGNGGFQRKRRNPSKDKSELLLYCGHCLQFISTLNLYRHKCLHAKNKKTETLAVTNIQGSIGDEFSKKVLPQLRRDSIGNFILQNPKMQALGFEEYKIHRASGKSIQAEIRTRKYMRSAGAVVHAAIELARSEGKNLDVPEVFHVENINYTERVIEELSLKQGESSASLQSYGYALKRAASALQTFHLNEGNEAQLAQTERYLRLFPSESFWKILFKRSEVNKDLKRMDHSRLKNDTRK